MLQLFIGLAALFIAGCSAYFSVRGLGLLFAGAAVPVMVMAASLEIGKLVAASFLYQYWYRIGVLVKLYLSFAVVVLVCITSLGIYGYLARAYERTNSDVALLQQQIESLQREIVDTQHRIDGSRSQIGKASDVERADREKLREQIKQAGVSFEQSLARVEERRKSARVKRDRDAETLQKQSAQSAAVIEQSLARLDDRRKATQAKRDAELARLDARVADVAKELSAAVDSEDLAIATLNDSIAVLDRAVDAYTKEGGAGFLKVDSIKKGQLLRKEQQPQRDAIAKEIAQHRETQDKLRAANDVTRKSLDQEIAAARERFTRDSTSLDDEEKTLRTSLAENVTSTETRMAALGDRLSRELADADDTEKSLRNANTDALGSLERQLASLQAKDQNVTADGSAQIEAMYQRLRAANEEIRHLQERIAATDVGSYRFVARAFNTPVDDVVKWLMLIIVVVFDPLAVALTIGFNVSLTGGKRSEEEEHHHRAVGASASSTVSSSDSSQKSQRAPLGLLGKIAVAAVCVIFAVVAIGGAGYAALVTLKQRNVVSASVAIPSDSFAVLAVRPQLFRAAAAASPSPPGATGPVASPSQPLAAAISDLLAGGFDPEANVYLFAKYPSQRSEKPSDRPTIICGLVASIADPVAAELTLSRCAESIARVLRPAAGEGASLSSNRVMVQSGNGKYLDPEGGFFTFGITPTHAILLLEIEGDPTHPTVTREIQRCLGEESSTASASASNPTQQPAWQSRQMPAGGAVAIWFDSARCFADMPKSAAAQARYQQLAAHLNFDLSLVIKPTETGAVELVGEYSYSGERFRDRAPAPVVDVLAKLGSPDGAGVPGRLMDRCADTLDFDSMIDRLRLTLANPRDGGPRALVVVEKQTPTPRDGRFRLTAQYDSKTGAPLTAVVRNIWPF